MVKQLEFEFYLVSVNTGFPLYIYLLVYSTCSRVRHIILLTKSAEWCYSSWIYFVSEIRADFWRIATTHGENVRCLVLFHCGNYGPKIATRIVVLTKFAYNTKNRKRKDVSIAAVSPWRMIQFLTRKSSKNKKKERKGEKERENSDGLHFSIGTNAFRLNDPSFASIRLLSLCCWLDSNSSKIPAIFTPV